MLLAACGNDRQSDLDPGQARLVGTEWTLVSNSKEPLPRYGEGAPTLRIEDGNAEIFTGCNHGTGEATVAGDFVTFGPIEVSEMACPGTDGKVEANYLSALEGRMGFDFHERWLTLSRSSQLTFEPPPDDEEALGGAEPAPELVGVNWELLAATDYLGSVIRPADDARPPAITFDPVDQVSIFTGCNSGSAPVEIRGPSVLAEVKVGPIQLTGKACTSDRARNLEKAMLRILKKPMVAMVDGEVLKLESDPATDDDKAFTFRAAGD